MASIRKRGKYYSAQFRVATATGGGKLVSLKTRKSDPNEARRFAASAEHMAAKAAASSTAHGEAYADVLLQAIRDAGAARLSEAKAREYLGRIVEIARGRPLRSFTVRQWFDEFHKQKQPNLAVSTASAYRGAYDSFLVFLGERADGGIEHVEDSDVRAWRDELKRVGLSDKRVNNMLKYLSGPFSKAAKTGMIPINPVAATESLLVRDSFSRKPFDKTEVGKLLRAAPDVEWRVVILLGVYCGMRLGDAANRKWGDFDLKAGTVSFVPEKKRRRGKAVVLPLHSRLMKEIRSMAKRNPQKDDWLTPGLAEHNVNGNQGLSTRFIAIMADAEVGRGASAEGVGRGRSRFERSFHSTRHTAASWLAEAGVDEDVRMLVTDHESREVAQKYTHRTIDTLRAAIKKLPVV